MTEETVQIEIGGPLVLHLIKEITDVLLLPSRNLIFVRRLDGNGIAFIRVKPRFLLPGIGIDFDQITTRQGNALIVFRCHLRDIHTVLIDCHLVAQLITTFVFAIEQHVDSCTIGRIVHTESSAEFEGQQVAHQRLVTVVIDQRPFLCLSRGIKHVLFGIELDSPRFLGEVA